MLLEARNHKQFILVPKSKAGSELRDVVIQGKVHRTVGFASEPQDLLMI